MNGYNNYGTTQIPIYWYNDTEAVNTNNAGDISSVNEGVYDSTTNNVNQSYIGGLGGAGGRNVNNDSGVGGDGGSGGYARVFFII
jgi:hypothetical protein